MAHCPSSLGREHGGEVVLGGRRPGSAGVLPKEKVPGAFMASQQARDPGRVVLRRGRPRKMSIVRAGSLGRLPVRIVLSAAPSDCAREPTLCIS